MGAWGSGSFENDDASDWLAQLGTMEPDDLTKIFGKAAHDTAYFEAPDASIVVAAAEVVAALNGFHRQGSSTRNCEMDGKSIKADSGTKSPGASSLGSGAGKL